MKIYIAAAWRRRTALIPLAVELKQCGVDVVSTWINAESASVDGFTDVDWDLREQLADAFLQQIEDCQVLVLMAEQGEQGPTCTRHAEFGIALGLGKQIVIVGEPTNPLQHHQRVKHIPDWAALLEWLAEHVKDEELLTVRYVARRLGITRQAVNEWCAKGELPAVRGARRGKHACWMIPRREFERLRVARARYGHIVAAQAPAVPIVEGRA